MQVLSELVSKAIELTGGPDEKETSIFCNMFDFLTVLMWGITTVESYKENLF